MQMPPEEATKLMNIDSLVKKYDMLPRGARVLCAVSGGADSVCLLHHLHERAGDLGITVICAHFNHMLRGAESDRDELFVQELCLQLGVEFVSGRGEVAAFATEKGVGVEEAAREMRYAFLTGTALKHACTRIATAHNANDNAETVIMNLARGSGAAGLSGIPPVRGIIVRPLLETTRAEIEGYLKQRGLSHVEDSTNAGDDYARNRVRHGVMPLLENFNSGSIGNIARAARLVREDNECLTSLAQDFVSANLRGKSLPAEKLAQLPRPVSSRAVRLMCDRKLSEKHVEAVLRLCRPGVSGAGADLPGMSVVREFDLLVFDGSDSGMIEKRELFDGLSTEIEGGFEISCQSSPNGAEVNSSLNTFFFKCENICGKMFVRSRLPGDSIRLSSRGCTKSLKKLFAESKIPASCRDLIPVIADEKGPVAVYGFGVSERCAAIPGESALKIEIREI